LVAVIV
jgi:hypothetical protein